MTGVSAAALAKRYPVLYHMAWDGSWPSILQHGLLSTSTLLDRLGMLGAARQEIESLHRPDSVPVRNGAMSVVFRDQKPMGDSGLQRCLQGGLKPADWYRMLNQFVFFWVTQERLMKLLDARAYRGQSSVVITLETSRLLAKHQADVVLSPINSGCTKPFPHPRGPDTFQPLHQYPFDALVKKRGRSGEPVVELAVRGGVPNVSDIAELVQEYKLLKPVKTLWRRP